MTLEDLRLNRIQRRSSSLLRSFRSLQRNLTLSSALRESSQNLTPNEISFKIGVLGSPSVGKATLISALTSSQLAPAHSDPIQLVKIDISTSLPDNTEKNQSCFSDVNLLLFVTEPSKLMDDVVHLEQIIDHFDPINVIVVVNKKDQLEASETYSGQSGSLIRDINNTGRMLLSNGLVQACCLSAIKGLEALQMESCDDRLELYHESGLGRLIHCIDLWCAETGKLDTVAQSSRTLRRFLGEIAVELASAHERDALQVLKRQETIFDELAVRMGHLIREQRSMLLERLREEKEAAEALLLNVRDLSQLNERWKVSFDNLTNLQEELLTSYRSIVEHWINELKQENLPHIKEVPELRLTAIHVRDQTEALANESATPGKESQDQVEQSAEPLYSAAVKVLGLSGRLTNLFAKGKETTFAAEDPEVQKETSVRRLALRYMVGMIVSQVIEQICNSFEDLETLLVQDIPESVRKQLANCMSSTRSLNAHASEVIALREKCQKLIELGRMT